MKKIISKNKIGFIVLLALLIIGVTGVIAYAAPNTSDVPGVNISVGSNPDGTPQDYVDNIKLLVLLTILSIAPSIIIMVTSFTRIIVVFSFLKTAIGASQSIPSQILAGLALFLTLFIMSPVITEINDKAVQPYLEEKITQEEAIDNACAPLREFMLKQTRETDLELFLDISNSDNKEEITRDLDGESKDSIANLDNKEEITRENIPMTVVIPAFAISELKTAFQIGFLLYLPFILIDLVVGSVLMSMGMFMLPPAAVSIPFKLLLFVMVDGWNLITKSLVMSFSG